MDWASVASNRKKNEAAQKVTPVLSCPELCDWDWNRRGFQQSSKPGTGQVGLLGATKPEDPSPVLRTHMVEGENWLLHIP